MKKILIVSHAMELGGVERSLLGLLNALDSKKYSIDLFLLRQEGELLKNVPKTINLLPEIPEYTVLARPIKDVIKDKHFLLAGMRMFGKGKAKLYVKRKHLKHSGVALEYSHKYLCPFMPYIQEKIVYDLAISFLTPHYFVSKKVNAKRKMAWIHTDYSKVQINKESELKMWSSYDYIASISEAVTESFVKVFPSLERKVVLIENILPLQLIKKQMLEFDGTVEMSGKGIKLLSVGRYCEAKNFDNIPSICSFILKAGVDVTWYIIGFGSDEGLIRQRIKEEKMEKYVILLGQKANPYPYMNVCDIYIQPSRYEGKSVAVREAQLLKKPVIITNYATASSQIEDGNDGVIVPLDNQECAKGIVDFIQNQKLQNNVKHTLSNRDYTNKEEVNKIYKILESKNDT